jgi:hypothetical protein
LSFRAGFSSRGICSSLHPCHSEKRSDEESALVFTLVIPRSAATRNLLFSSDEVSWPSSRKG